MKRKIFYGLGAVIIGAFTIAAVANGPYYALPAWAQKLACAVGNCPRFIELADWNSEAVLDRETGLVWEKSPAITGGLNGSGLKDWFSAQSDCNQLAKGNRKGWRVPTLQELASLVDPSVASPGPTLPAGHPFHNVQSSTYWSATTFSNLNTAWTVTFSSGIVGIDNKDFITFHFVWCVRGGQGVDPQ